jgi:fluoride exporter
VTPAVVAVVGLAAGVGAALRYTVDRLVQRYTGGVVVPWGTMAANAAGSLLLGLIAGLALDDRVDPTTVAIVGAGLCGGLTTFSTWSYETLRLLEDGALRAAGVNIGVSLALGLVMAAGGLALAGAI